MNNVRQRLQIQIGAGYAYMSISAKLCLRRCMQLTQIISILDLRFLIDWQHALPIVVIPPDKCTHGCLHGVMSRNECQFSVTRACLARPLLIWHLHIIQEPRQAPTKNNCPQWWACSSKSAFGNRSFTGPEPPCENEFALVCALPMVCWNHGCFV